MTNSFGDPPDAKPTMDSRIGWLMVAVAFLSSFFLIRSYLGQSPAAGGQADYSWKVKSLDGKTGTLASYKGKPVFLNVWATWCGPCREEMPSIAKLSTNPRLKDVAFLCVSIDDELDQVKAYLGKTGSLPMTVLHAESPAPAPFQTRGIPATFLIAPDGRIVRTEVGGMNWDDPQIIDFLATLTKS